jgi:RNA polymerase sigma-70 factor (ECF subfamily)
MKFNYEEESKIGNLKDEYPEEKEEMDILKLKAEVIIELIQKLSPAYKTVFNLYVVEDLSHKEIAEKLNVSVGTSKSNLAKAKIKLRKLYSNTIEHEIKNKI